MSLHTTVLQLRTLIDATDKAIGAATNAILAARSDGADDRSIRNLMAQLHALCDVKTNVRWLYEELRHTLN